MVTPIVGKIYKQVGYPTGSNFLVIEVLPVMKLARAVGLGAASGPALPENTMGYIDVKDYHFAFFGNEVKPKPVVGTLYANALGQVGLGQANGKLKLIVCSAGTVYGGTLPEVDYDADFWKVRE